MYTNKQTPFPRHGFVSSSPSCVWRRAAQGPGLLAVAQRERRGTASHRPVSGEVAAGGAASSYGVRGSSRPTCFCSRAMRSSTGSTSRTNAFSSAANVSSEHCPFSQPRCVCRRTSSQSGVLCRSPAAKAAREKRSRYRASERSKPLRVASGSDVLPRRCSLKISTQNETDSRDQSSASAPVDRAGPPFGCREPRRSSSRSSACIDTTRPPAAFSTRFRFFRASTTPLLVKSPNRSTA
mmetsp:Transcript_3713/g.11210  ORF Transcript_3713/g.11210 Transcript_3713/m.11210 type:complete len:238 (-) Transcript_3713:229-942(-)